MRDTDESRWDEMNRWKQHIQSDTVDMERQMRKCHQYLSFEIQNEGGKKERNKEIEREFFFFRIQKEFQEEKEEREKLSKIPQRITERISG